MQKKGHYILFTCRDKEVAAHLLEAYKFNRIVLGKPFKKIVGKILGLIKFDFLLSKIAWKFKPDILLSAGSIYAAQVAWLLNKPHVTFEDTGNMEQIRLYKPFSNIILVPSAFQKELGEKQIRYISYHELAYLHPHYFQPDPGILDILKIKKDERYVVVRFVSWQATHDLNQRGLTFELKRKLVEMLSKSFRILISSETTLPDDLARYRITTSPERMHDVLAFAELYIGEGATMASECAMLGTPAIYVNSITLGYLEDQEKHGLIYSFRSSEGVLDKALELIDTPNLRQIHQGRRQKMLADKIDITAFMVWFIENYPHSVEVMKTNPDYQGQFK